MPELFLAMLREEWRVHSEVFGSVGFALFPAFMAVVAAMGTLVVPLVNASLPAGDLAALVHVLFVLIGAMAGGFGLVGDEAMNRRFGQVSFVAYAARTLPVSERRIFAAFVAKDTLYYLVLWIAPVIAGVAIASPLSGIPFATVLRLALTLFLSFLSGLGAVFLLSTVWSRSRIAFALASGTGAVLLLAGFAPFLPLALYREFSWPVLAGTLILIGAALVVSLFLYRPRAAGGEPRRADRFSTLVYRLRALPYPALAAKDLLDLWRSGGGIAQILFGLLLPLGLCWFLLSLLAPVLPPDGVLLLFAVLTGVLGSTIYTWLTAFDAFGPYACLPVGTGGLIQSKLTSFALLQVVPAAVVVAAALVTGAPAVAVPALGLALGLSAWSVAVTVYLAGLSPNVLVYDPRVLAAFLGGVGAPLLALVVLAFVNPWLGLVGLLLGPPAGWLVSAGIRRWERADTAFF